MIKLTAGYSELLPVKNIPRIIRVVSRIKNTKLGIVGDGQERNYLEKLAKQLDITDRVIFYGRVSNEKARQILRNSDIFILNSFHEGMPHALLEALMEGVPVIATKIPAVLEVLTDKENAVFVDANTDQSLTLAVKQLVNDVGLQKRLSQNGRKLAREKFTWQAHLNKLLTEFNNLTGK